MGDLKMLSLFSGGVDGASIAADGSQATRNYLISRVRKVDGERLAQATYERADGAARVTLTDRRKATALATMVEAWEGVGR